MESKMFWNKMLEAANRNMPKEYPFTMEEPSEIYTDIPSDCEARIFETILKDGKRYGKGLYYAKEQIHNGDVNPETSGIHLADSMERCFKNLEEDNG
jgi:hypothetical protein